MASSYNNFLDKMRAQNYASIRKSANNNVTIHGPNTFNCVKKKSIMDSGCCDKPDDNHCGSNYPYITNHSCNNCCNQPCNCYQTCNCNQGCYCDPIFMEGHTGHRGPAGPAGPTGSIGPIGPIGLVGPTGNKGDPGSPSGLVLFLDKEQDTLTLNNYQIGISTNYISPNNGSLLSVPASTASSLITYTFSDSYKVNTPILLSTFITPPNSLASVVVPGGVWGLNVFASAKYDTNDLRVFGKIYYVDSNGNNPVLVGDGYDTSAIVRQFCESYMNDINIPIFTLPNTTYRIKLELYILQSKNTLKQNGITIWVRNLMTNLYTTLYSATGSGGGGGGAKGDTGAPGSKGDTGAPGSKGDTGEAGAQGEVGEKGEKGDTGPAGPAGSGGSSIGSATSTFYIAFLYTVNDAAGASDYNFADISTNLPSSAFDISKDVTVGLFKYLQIKNKKIVNGENTVNLMPITQSYIYAKNDVNAATVSDWAKNPVYVFCSSTPSSQVIFLNSNVGFGLSTPNISIYNKFFAASGCLSSSQKLDRPGGSDDTLYPLVYLYLTFLTSIC